MKLVQAAYLCNIWRWIKCKKKPIAWNSPHYSGENQPSKKKKNQRNKPPSILLYPILCEYPTHLTLWLNFYLQVCVLLKGKELFLHKKVMIEGLLICAYSEYYICLWVDPLLLIDSEGSYLWKWESSLTKTKLLKLIQINHLKLISYTCLKCTCVILCSVLIMKKVFLYHSEILFFFTR